MADRVDQRGASGWRRAAWLMAAMSGALGSACAGTPERGRLETPEVLVAPYDSVRGETLWAVAPLGNESGVSSVDAGAISDALVVKVTEVRGLACVPLNRTLAAMRALGMNAVNSPGAARALANALGVDGLVVGTITAYDPYEPPKVGLSLALFVRDASEEMEAVDPIRLRTAYTDGGGRMPGASASSYMERPASVVSEVYDGSNHQVQMDLRRYAAGRSDPDSSLGWRVGLVSMETFTGFASQQALARLLQNERLRLAQARAADAAAKAQADAGAGGRPR